MRFLPLLLLIAPLAFPIPADAGICEVTFSKADLREKASLERLLIERDRALVDLTLEEYARVTAFARKLGLNARLTPHPFQSGARAVELLPPGTDAGGTHPLNEVVAHLHARQVRLIYAGSVGPAGEVNPSFVEASRVVVMPLVDLPEADAESLDLKHELEHVDDWVHREDPEHPAQPYQLVSFNLRRPFYPTLLFTELKVWVRQLHARTGQLLESCAVSGGSAACERMLSDHRLDTESYPEIVRITRADLEKARSLPAGEWSLEPFGGRIKAQVSLKPGILKVFVIGSDRDPQAEILRRLDSKLSGAAEIIGRIDPVWLRYEAAFRRYDERLLADGFVPMESAEARELHASAEALLSAI